MSAGANPFELDEQAVSPVDIADSIVRIAQDQAVSLGIDLSRSVEPDVPMLWADPRKLKQILLNLVSNALKFTKPGGRVAIQMYREPDGRIGMSVSDTGVGIAHDRLAILKEDMLKGRREPSPICHRRYDGPLGLWISRMLVELHGATIDIESKLYIGTTATVIFPKERTVTAPAPGCPL